MAITTSTRRNAAKPVEKVDREAEIKDFYTEPAREELGEQPAKQEKKKRVKNPNKTEYLIAIEKALMDRIEEDAKDKGITRAAWMIRAYKTYLGDKNI
jgi:hypothetical protein